MDIRIVNTILRLCIEKQTCLFEISSLCNYCLEQHLCTNPKYVLASVKNYMEIFKISRDKNRIELFMPFEICRNSFHDDITLCSNCHLCYDYFYTNVCRSPSSCPYPHVLTEKYHKNILGTLISLDLDLLTKAFRVYCQSKKQLINPKIQPQSISTPTSSSSIVNNSRVPTSPQINGNSSWKTNNRLLVTLRTLPQQPSKPEKGVQICWDPQKNIQTHFIEVIFSNQGKSNGGPIRSSQIFQHLGVAQVFYQNSNTAEQVVQHEPIKFQSFIFTSRLLQRSIDKRHVCLSNIPVDINQLKLYIDKISIPYKRSNFKCYQNDKRTIIVEYDEDINFSKISQNVRNHPECNGQIIDCIQLYNPEVLLIEYDKEYLEENIIKMFDEKKIFHIKTYSYCCFVHFYSHDDLVRTISGTCNNNNAIRMTPIYIDIYSEKHLDDYLQRRQIEIQTKPTRPLSITVLDEAAKRDLILVLEKLNSAEKSRSSIPVLPPPPIDKKSETPVVMKINNNDTTVTQETIVPNAQPKLVLEENMGKSDDEEIVTSEDDFHSLTSDFDNDDLFLDDTTDDQGDMEYLRSAAKNLMTSLSEMEEASASAETDDTPRSLLYGDDYVITIKSRRFTLAFLDYTQYRVEKQRNPDRFRLLASLKKLSNNKKRLDHTQERDQIPSPTTTTEAKTNKKKRHKRSRKKKSTNNRDKDAEIDLTD